jgi:hypothetical protein
MWNGLIEVMELPSHGYDDQMKCAPKDRYIERGPFRFVGTRGFYFFFVAVTVVAFFAGFRYRGPAIFAFPLIAWSPFLVLVSVHVVSGVFGRARDSGTRILPRDILVGCAYGIGVSFGFMCFPLFPLNSWIMPLAFFCLSIVWIVFRKTENSVVWAVANAAGMGGLGIYLAVFALWMMFAPSVRAVRVSSAHPPAAVSSP